MADVAKGEVAVSPSPQATDSGDGGAGAVTFPWTALACCGPSSSVRGSG